MPATNGSICQQCEAGYELTADALKCVPAIDSFFTVAAAPDTLLATLLLAALLFVAVLVLM